MEMEQLTVARVRPSNVLVAPARNVVMLIALEP
jgi:hypothetical protein